MKIMITHFDKLVDRKKSMTYQLNKYNLDFEFVSNKGKDKLTEEDRSKFDKKLKDSEISIMLHHFECYKKIVENDHDYAMILEDDVVLGHDFRRKIEKYINDLPLNWDMLFFGEGHGAHIPNYRLRSGINIYKKSTDLCNQQVGGVNGSTRCLDSYVISKKCCQRILEKINQPNYFIFMPIDHLLNFINYYNHFNIYWAEPTITVQGSTNGTFNSSIR
jgi:glycosyl transferase family 25